MKREGLEANFQNYHNGMEKRAMKIKQEIYQDGVRKRAMKGENMDEMKELKLKASNGTLYTVLDAIEALLVENNCPDTDRTGILIAVEELYVNIANYAYGGREGEAVVQMEVTQDPSLCRVVLKDWGVQYNPLEKTDPDIMLSADEREVGGLGIFMAKQYMDKMEYRYEDGCNILTIEKNLGAQES